MALVAKVEILGEYKNLTKATRGATDNLKKMDKKVGGFSRSMRGSLAGIAAGLSFAALTRGLTDATTAAREDNKAQAILAATLVNTVGANKAVIDSVNEQVSTWQNANGVLDDEIRPAYGKLVASTEDITEANKLMELAFDVSAGTGKDLLTTSTLLAKAHGGNVKALDKLVPGISAAKDPMKELADTYAGMAATAAENDPMSVISVRMADLQEQLGMKLLPYLQDFADWLVSDKGTDFLDSVATGIEATGGFIADMVEGLQWAGYVLEREGKKWEAFFKGDWDTFGRLAGQSIDAQRAAFDRQQNPSTVDPRAYIPAAPGTEPELADGGIVLPRPGGTRAIIGEAGQAEAVIPLDRLGNMGGSNQYVININKANVSGKEVVDAIRRYETSNGRRVIN